MKIVRSPLRISLGGGGTDLPGWYSQYGGFLLTAAINKYIYFTGCERPFDNKFWLSYSKVEVCDKVEDIRHELLNKCFSKYNLPRGIEMHSISEVPGSSGLGSSGAFIVGTLKTLNLINKTDMSLSELAETACRVEMVELKKSSGKQDQYIATYGGIIGMTLDKEGNVEVQPLDLTPMTVKRLESNLLIYYTGISRDAEVILAEQSNHFVQKNDTKIAMMKKIQEIGFQSRDALLAGKVDELGPLMHDHWLAKKQMSDKMSAPAIDETYEYAREYGCTGGKIMGAGGGGYWMFYVPPERQLDFRTKMVQRGLVEMDWRFDHLGCSVVYAA